MAVRTGLQAKCYYTPLLDPTDDETPLTTPTPEVPGSFPATGIPVDTANTPSVTMVELTNIRDCSTSLTKSEADITTRGNNGWRQTVGLLKDGSMEFEMVWDSSDPGFVNVQYCFMNDLHIFFAVMDGDLSTTTSGYRVQGIYSPFVITDLSRSEGLEEALIATVSAKPTLVTNYPTTWIDRVHA